MAGPSAPMANPPGMTRSPVRSGHAPRACWRYSWRRIIEPIIAPNAIPGRDREQQRRPVRTASAGTNVAGLLSVRRGDVHDTATALGAELHLALREREQRVVATAADVLARVEVSAVLADDDLADAHGLTAEALDTKPLGVGVTAVLRGRCALFVCHVSTPHLIPVTLTWVYRCLLY